MSYSFFNLARKVAKSVHTLITQIKLQLCQPFHSEGRANPVGKTADRQMIQIRQITL